MKIIEDFPPNYDRLVSVFPIGNTVIFAWGEIIFNPNRIDIPPSLIAHEEAHGARQLKDVTGWWDQYIEDINFRLSEEVVAHAAEYAYLLEHGNRRERRAAMKIVSEKLAAPLYGQMISRREAESIIKKTLGGI
jgi:hypothetical protein